MCLELRFILVKGQVPVHWSLKANRAVLGCNPLSVPFGVGLRLMLASSGRFWRPLISPQYVRPRVLDALQALF
jgi:hypothetical protein